MYIQFCSMKCNLHIIKGGWACRGGKVGEAITGDMEGEYS